jgi:hypothetical protein
VNKLKAIGAVSKKLKERILKDLEILITFRSELPSLCQDRFDLKAITFLSIPISKGV